MPEPVYKICLPLVLLAGIATAQITKPGDAPRPLSPDESVKRFKVPDGFRVELVASEPLIRQPSGICWDSKGRMYVCELHGYNLEGQFDIEELNKTGNLDREVRRVQAAERHKKSAEKETFGTIKVLVDLNHDGQMDKAIVFADRLPPCLGICPANGGIIAACHTKIIFLADRDGDHKAETQEVLFEGFRSSPVERSVNSPQWGPDNWIYLGSSAGGGKISGRYLGQTVSIPNTDIRIRPDGSAIEPIIGQTGTMGFAFTEGGDRFVVSTGMPGIQVAPIEWQDLARNPNAAPGRLAVAALSSSRVWPTSQPHPWRTRRAEDPGFSKFYRDRYGIQESTPNGYFTSACSPLVYRDTALPGLTGHLLACEPAQNLIHRSVIKREGNRLKLTRHADESESEFLTSSDPWFHAISLAHAPDGSIYIVDFYREIIEDYSAIPRYLQQQYGLIAGKNRGRIWRLSHQQMPLKNQSSDMSQLSDHQLVNEVCSPRFWRRETARRMLVERTWDSAQAKRLVAAKLASRISELKKNAAVMNVMSTLEGMNAVSKPAVLAGLNHSDPLAIRQAIKLSEPMLDGPEFEPEVFEKVIGFKDSDSSFVRLQLALSMGECSQAQALEVLALLAREHGSEQWISEAILSSISNRGGRLLALLVRRPSDIGHAEKLCEQLCMVLARRQEPTEMSQALELIAQVKHPGLQRSCLFGLKTGLSESSKIELSEGAKAGVKRLAAHESRDIHSVSRQLLRLLNIETRRERLARIELAMRVVNDVQRPSNERISAVHELADAADDQIGKMLVSVIPNCTPLVKDAVVKALIRNQKWTNHLLTAIESNDLSPNLLDSIDRATLLDSNSEQVKRRARKILRRPSIDLNQQFKSYQAALTEKRDLKRGAIAYQNHCGKCHRAHGTGHRVGPDLSSEFLRAEQTILHDVLNPNDKISPGYRTFLVGTTSGKAIAGILVEESPTSITLRQAEGKDQVVLRKNIEQFQAMRISMMPDDLGKTVSPKDLADLVAWMRRPPVRLVLVDENRELLNALNEGSGTAEFVGTDRSRGAVSLKVTPPQRYSRQIPNWSFRIRENPKPGEYRYLRFSWKSTSAHGVMIELADQGSWPPAQKALRRYHAGRNTTGWASIEVSPKAPTEWVVVTRDLWKDFGDFTLTGFAPTTMGGDSLFDQIELLQTSSVD